MAKRTISIPKLAKAVTDEASAYTYLEGLRWPNGPVCPHCRSTKAYFLTPKDTAGRKTRMGTRSPRRVWKCAKCRKQFSVLTGTIFHGTKIPVRTWIFVVYEMCASKNGVSAREIERKYDLTPKSAWFMCHRIREAMADGDPSLFSGLVTADETWIGGEARNRHKHQRYAQDNYDRDDKAVVLSLVHRESGQVRSRVVRNVRGATLLDAITRMVDLPNTVLHTDQAGAYVRIGWKAKGHERVNHAMGEYVRGAVTTNHAEGYFSQLKRSLDGTFHRVSEEHLGRYLSEFDFRWSTRKLDDGARMMRLLGQTERRLSYRPLIGG